MQIPKMAEDLIALRDEVVPENESFADMVKRLTDIEFEALLVYMRISGRDQSMIDLISSVRKHPGGFTDREVKYS